MDEISVSVFPKTWDQVHKDSIKLAQLLLNNGVTYKRIACVTRGGLVPSGIVAQELHLHHIDTICIKTYKDSGSTEKVGVIKGISDENDGEGVLVIDDLTDTGHTAKLVREMLPRAHIAVLYAKPNGKSDIDTYVSDVSQKTWMVFPWEPPMDETNIDDAQRDDNI